MTEQTFKDTLEQLHTMLHNPLRRVVETRTDLFVHDQNKPERTSTDWTQWNNRLAELRKECATQKSIIDQAIAKSDLPKAAQIELSRHVEDCIVREANRRATSTVATEEAQIAFLSYYEKTRARSVQADDKKSRLEAELTRKLYNETGQLGI